MGHQGLCLGRVPDRLVPTHGVAEHQELVHAGGEQWVELLDGPVDDGPWTASRWKLGQTGQFASALERGELWSEDGARLSPQPGRDHRPIWSQAGTLQVTRDVRYNSKRVMAERTNTRTPGIRAWFALTSLDEDLSVYVLQEMALALWCNSTHGLLLHANHANRAQQGRGTGNKGMMESLPTLDVRQLQSWQLD